MHKCKPKFTLLLPVDMNGLTGGGGEGRNDRHHRWAIPKEQMSHTSVSGRLEYTNMREGSAHAHTEVNTRSHGACKRANKGTKP